ncbi:MAG: hypothetical protein IJB26_03035 [Clostridia bacterium]|nr:hypothetical protein [Clostridia bacterium]
MKPDKLSDAIGLTDEALVEEADRARRVVRRDRRWWVQWVAIAACLCLVAACALSMPRVGTKLPSDVSQPPFSVSTTTTAPSTTTTTGNRPVVSKAMAVSQAVYPDRAVVSHFETRSKFNDGKYADGLFDFYTPTIRQFLVGEDGENRVFSPLNAYMALAMLAETTDGNGRQQILDLLHVENMSALREKVKILWEVNYDKTQYNASLLANSVWMSNAFSYNQQTLDTLAENYYASAFCGEMGDATYTAMLQNWINEQTEGVLEEQVSGVQLDPSTVLNLVSTVYFGAKWIDEFDPELTEEGVFYAANGDVICDFMHGEESLRYVSHADGYKAMSHALGGGYEMVFVLPNEGVSVNEVIGKDSLYSVLGEVSHPKVTTERWMVTLTMPKFDVQGDVNLIDGLKALGVTDIFDAEKADFSPMLENADGVAVSAIQHAARVTVDEQGCTAAAFWRSDMGFGAPEHNGPLAFTLDRPFLFFIKNQSQGAVLFAGVVECP